MIVTVLCVLVIVGVFLWAIEQLPMDVTIRTIIRVVAIVAVCLYLLRVFGLLARLP